MPRVQLDDLSLYYEVIGQGDSLVLCHEFAGDYSSWEKQVEFFSKYYTVITYNARGYPPSDVPVSVDAYSQDKSVQDLRNLLEYLGVEKTHIVGLSMGGNVALNFGLTYPERVISIVVAGTGTGSNNSAAFRIRVNEFANQLDSGGMEAISDYTIGPTRIQLLRKNPEEWNRFSVQFAQHSARGSALTFRGVQGCRPSIFDLETELRVFQRPTLIMVGDEDDPCIETSIFLKNCVSKSGLVIFPRSGHAINLEEPELFNQTIYKFFREVENGDWTERDFGSDSGSLI